MTLGRILGVFQKHLSWPLKEMVRRHLVSSWASTALAFSQTGSPRARGVLIELYLFALWMKVKFQVEVGSTKDIPTGKQVGGSLMRLCALGYPYISYFAWKYSVKNSKQLRNAVLYQSSCIQVAKQGCPKSWHLQGAHHMLPSALLTSLCPSLKSLHNMRTKGSLCDFSWGLQRVKGP